MQLSSARSVGKWTPHRRRRKVTEGGAGTTVPGWRSTGKVIEFLFEEIRAGTLRSAPLRAFLLRAECKDVPAAGEVAAEAAQDIGATAGTPLQMQFTCPGCDLQITVPLAEGTSGVGQTFSCTCGKVLRVAETSAPAQPN